MRAVLLAAAAAALACSAESLYMAECLKRESDGLCSEAAVAWATVLELMSGDSLDRNWPLGVLALDVDVVERNSSHPFLQSLYAGAPAQRVALALDLPAGVPLGTYDAAARARPSDAQLDKACRTLRMFMPELPLQPCGGDAAPGDLDLRQAAVAAPTVLRRDGTVGSNLLAPRDTAIYSPASAADAIGSEEAAAKAAALAALRARFGEDSVREGSDGSDSTGSGSGNGSGSGSGGVPRASSVILGLRWGAGHLAPVMATTGSSRAVLAATALDTPPRTAGYDAAAALLRAASDANDASARSAAALVQSDARFPSIVGHILGARDAESAAAALHRAQQAGEALATEQQHQYYRSSPARLVDGYAQGSLGGVGLASEEERLADAERVQRALAAAFAEPASAALSSADTAAHGSFASVHHFFGGAHVSLLPRFEQVEVPVSPSEALAESLATAGSGDPATGTQAQQQQRTRLAVTRVAMVYLETGVVTGRAAASALVREFDATEESRVSAAVAAGGAVPLTNEKPFILTALRGGLRAPTAAATAAAIAAGMSSDLAAAGSRWATSLHRSMKGTGLHRDLAYTAHASTTIPASALPHGFLDAYLARGSGSGSGSAASSSSASSSSASWSTHTLTSFLPRCRIALLQRLEATSYLDLDEVREQQRNAAPLLTTYGAGAEAAAAAAGAGASSVNPAAAEQQTAATVGSSGSSSGSQSGLDVRAFARYIDVERPTSLSTQHIVALSVPLRERAAVSSSSSPSSASASASASGSADTSAGASAAAEGAAIDAAIASDRSGAYAEVQLAPAPGSQLDESGRPTALSLRLSARFGTLFHVRYQSTGCSSAAAAATASVANASAPVSSGSGSGPAAASRGAWVDAMSSAYGAQLHADGSVELLAPRPSAGSPEAAGAQSEEHASATDALWGRLATLKSRVASFAGMGPSVGAVDADAGAGAHAGTGPSELPLAMGVQWPYVDGCYAMAHLPVPTLHVQCDEEAPSMEDAAAAAASASGNAPSGLPSAALAAVLRAAQGTPGAAGGAVDSWASLPVTGPGSSALPFHAGFDAAHMPLLAPVPVGNRDHFRWVSPATAAIALGGAALVLIAAAMAKRDDILDSTSSTPQAALVRPSRRVR